MPEVLFAEKWWRLSQDEYNEAKVALKALIAKDPESGNSEQLRFVDKMLAKLHASILAIHGQVGEKEATEWLEAAKKEKEKGLVVKQPKMPPTPKKQTTKSTKKTASASASAEEGSAQSEELAQALAEKDSFKELLREQYAYLIEMDEIVREKLFILQIAVADGWSMAKAVGLRKAGKFADRDYQKEVEVRRAEGSKAKKPKTSESSGKKEGSSSKPPSQHQAPQVGFQPYYPYQGYQPYGGYNPWYQGQAQGYAGQPGGQLSNFNAPRRAGPTSVCYNCNNAGHFARECPTRPAAPVPKIEAGDAERELSEKENEGAKMETLSNNLKSTEMEWEGTEEENGIDWRVQKVFEPGKIHRPEHLSFWRETLKASEWVIDTLQNGYSIPFSEEPGRYEEKNNLSALQNMAIVRKQVAEMIELGVVRVVKEKPHCVSPLGLVTRTVDGVTKNRLVFDASRWVNLKIKDQKVTLSHLEKALELTEEKDLQATFDLKSAFYHIRIAEKDQKFLGAALENSDKSVTYFVYTHLPFGLKCAVHAITKIMKPVIAKLQSLGMRATIYIDDGRILARNEEQSRIFLNQAYSILLRSGWQLEVSKSDRPGRASTVKKYLGFIIDTMQMKVSADDAKVQKYSEAIKGVLRDKEVEVKGLSSVLGKIVSLMPSHGPVARIATRSGYIQVEEHVGQNGWGSQRKLVLSKPARQELLFFLMNIESRNGFPILNSLSAIRIDTIFAGAKSTKEFTRGFNNNVSFTNLVVSDASDVKAAVIELDEGFNKMSEMSFKFSDAERLLSSGHRELLSIKKALGHWGTQGLMKRRRIYWATDATNVVSFMEKGSSKPHIQELVFEVVTKLSEMESDVITVHLSRTDDRIVMADELSKKKNSDNWSIDSQSFEAIRKEFNLQVDLFANEANARLRIFYSEFYTEGCAGVDAFSQVWTRGLWVCPPIKKLLLVAREIRRRKDCEGVLVLPEWPTSSYYGAFFDGEGVSRWPFIFKGRFKPYIYQNEDAQGALRGKVNFSFVILYFNKF